MTDTMTTAWTIRKSAGQKWNCEIMEIHFGMCLSMAHRGEKIMEEIKNTNDIYKAAMELRKAIENKDLSDKDGTEKQLAFVKILKKKAINKIDYVVSEYYTDEEYDDDDTTDDMLNEMVGWTKHTLGEFIASFDKSWVENTITMLKKFK
jgi:hypothetical protein